MIASMPSSVSPSNLPTPSRTEAEAAPAWGPKALELQNERTRQNQSVWAATRAKWIRRNKYYYGCLKRLLQHLVEPGKRVLNIRCQTGHLLHALQPSYGV